jgi:hypothetical protein
MIRRNEELLAAIRLRDGGRAQAIISNSIKATISGDTQIYDPVSL